MTTAILGAALAVPTVKAQQSNSPETESPRQSTSIDRAARPSSTPKSTDDQVYGFAVTRGARYLLRNGLDYLNYKEYDRALKFLREAETRKDELNKAEKQVLQKGIETAKRGLRQAAGAEAPYALSEQSRNRNGFSPAKPEASVTQMTHLGRVQALPRNSVPGRSNGKTTPTINDTDDRGEPILLANGNSVPSGDSVPSNSSSQNSIVIQPSQTDSKLPTVPHDSEDPKQLPDIPKLPQFAQKLSETDDSPNELGKSTRQVNERISERMTDQPEVVVVPRQDTPVARASALAPAPLSPIKPRLNTSEPTPPVTTDDAPKGAPGLAVDDAPKGAPSLAVVDLETMPAVSPLPLVVHTGDSTSPAHKESEEASTVSTSDEVIAPSTQPVSSQSTPSTMPSADDLPPLPTDLGNKAELSDPPKQTLSPMPVPNGSTKPIPSAENELPPLPADVSNSAQEGRGRADQARVTTFENVAPTEVPGTAQDLPTLPDDLSGKESRHRSTDIPNAVYSPSATAPDTVQDATTAQPVVNSEVKPSNSIDNNAAQEVLPPISTSIEKSTAVVSPAATSPPMGDALPDVKPGSIEQPRSVLLHDNGVHSLSQPAADVSNQEAAQEAPVSTSSGTTKLEDTSLPPPAIENPPLPPSRSDILIPDRPNPSSTLRPELRREVEMIVRQQEDDLRRRQQAQGQPSGRGRDTIGSDLRAQTQLDISRAPSPAEARPIKAIPVPEDWVPLPPRTWAAQRKYWAAAATCHLPLYFQDPVLERYGHSVEQFFGPVGRYLTYPLDDPTQSTQRNQILQPFFSAGLFAFQIAALPYNVIMDPPWEAQYDLGYYRPGDKVPTDTYWLPLHGYGPPLRGSNY
jgi:hypothetical protein